MRRRDQTKRKDRKEKGLKGKWKGRGKRKSEEKDRLREKMITGKVQGKRECE